MSLKEMTFWEHLDELRSVLLRMLVVWGVTFVALVAVMPHIFDEVIMAPCSSDFVLYKALGSLSREVSFLPDFVTEEFTVSVINIKLTSQFFTHMSTALWLSLLLIFPYLLYELWAFVSPALYPDEKRRVRFVFGMGNVLFYVGVVVGYMLVFPLTLRFLANYQVSEYIPNHISLDSYMSNFITLTFAMGIVFELPLLCKLLSSMGIIDRSFFKQYRRHAIVALLILAAFITPSGDPFTLIVVFLPIYAVYELGALFVKPAPAESQEV